MDKQAHPEGFEPAVLVTYDEFGDLAVMPMSEITEDRSEDFEPAVLVTYDEFD